MKQESQGLKFVRLWGKSIGTQDVRPHVHCEGCGTELYHGDEAFRANKSGKLTDRFWCPDCGKKKQDSSGSREEPTKVP